MGILQIYCTYTHLRNILTVKSFEIKKSSFSSQSHATIKNIFAKQIESVIFLKSASFILLKKYTCRRTT